MPGAPDPIYVRARKVLLDALEALGAHRDKIVLVGAQAVYLHAGEGDLVVTPYTEDGDLALDPRGLQESPLLEECLRNAGFVQRVPAEHGRWFGPGDVEIDLMVPEQLAGQGTRSAEIPPHDMFTTRRADGLEAALVDVAWEELLSLEPELDSRVVQVRVAGPAALLVSKLIKIQDRAAGAARRMRDKDALDVYRLLVHVPTDVLAGSLARLKSDSLSEEVTGRALNTLASEFRTVTGTGIQMLGRAIETDPQADVVVARAQALAQQLHENLERQA